MTQSEKAGALRALHQPGRPVLFANCWDVASARMLVSLGLPAVATSSAAIANSLGYRDGQRVSKSEMLAVVERIAAAVLVPVTADMEAAYGASPAEWRQTALDLIVAGAVGCNLEDSEADETCLAPLELQVERLRAVRAAATAAGVPLVINARTDAMAIPPAAGVDAEQEAIRRARAYRAAGADCIFVLGPREIATIRRIVAAVPGPVNILGGPGMPSVADLAAAGVARISLGSGPYRAALGLLRRCATELRERGTYASLDDAPAYAQANDLMA